LYLIFLNCCIVFVADEENVIVIIGVDPGDDKHLNVKCDYSGTFMINSFQWKKVKTNKWHPPNEMLKKSQWYLPITSYIIIFITNN